MRPPKNSSRDVQNDIWNKKHLERKRLTMKEQIDRLAAEWRRANGDLTEDPTPDNKVPMEVHNLPKSPTTTTETPQAYVEVSELSIPPPQIMSSEQEEMTVAQLLFPKSPIFTRSDHVIPRPSSSSPFTRARSLSNASLVSSGGDTEPVATRARSVEIGAEPYIRPVIPRTSFYGLQASRREAEDDGKTDVEMKDITASTSSLRVQSPQPSRDNIPPRGNTRNSSSSSSSSPPPQQPKAPRIQDMVEYVPDSDEENIVRGLSPPSTTTATSIPANAPMLSTVFKPQTPSSAPQRSKPVVEILTSPRKRPATAFTDAVQRTNEVKRMTNHTPLRLGLP